MKKHKIFILLFLSFVVTNLYGQTSSISLSNGATILADNSQVCADDGSDDNGGSNFVTANGGSFCFTPSPVELTTFTAVLSGKSVILNWNTATEIVNFGFEIERQSQESNIKNQDENQSWTTLGFIEGHGNSNSSNDYSFIDTNPPSGNVRYRLKQIDVDGSSKYYYAEALDINGPKVFKLVQNYPNPFNPTTVITYSIPNASDVTLKVYNTIGEVVSTIVNEHQDTGKYNVTFNASNLPSGVYFYSLNAGKYSSVKKMLLVR